MGSIIILGVSIGLLLYWLRYSCLLIVRSYQEDSLASEVAQANGLRFLDVRARLGTAEPCPLEALYRSLEDDRRMLSFLLDHSAGPAIPGFERALLALDYAVMRMWYRAVRVLSAAQARSAILEMSEVLGCFAQSMGRRAAVRLNA
jgi:hypothetical protein